MALIPDRSLKVLFELNKNLWASIARDSAIPQTVKSMVYQHLQSQWIPDALAVVISPLSDDLSAFLKQSAFDLDGIQYYFPSMNFWLLHAEEAHPPAGQGCDPVAHSAFLTRDGSSAAFIYAVVRRDGSIVVEDAAGFQKECSFYLAGTGE